VPRGGDDPGLLLGRVAADDTGKDHVLVRQPDEQRERPGGVAGHQRRTTLRLPISSMSAPVSIQW
jgi:hypothetical protein